MENRKRNMQIKNNFYAARALTDAIFFPFIYLCGDEKNEAVLVLSLAAAAVIFLSLTSLAGRLFHADQAGATLLRAVFPILCAAAGEMASVPLAVRIFRRKEY